MMLGRMEDPPRLTVNVSNLSSKRFCPNIFSDRCSVFVREHLSRDFNAYIMYVSWGGAYQPDGAEKQSTELHDLVQRFPTEATRLHGHLGYAVLVTVVTPSV